MLTVTNLDELALAVCTGAELEVALAELALAVLLLVSSHGLLPSWPWLAVALLVLVILVLKKLAIDLLLFLLNWRYFLTMIW